jgi:6,7-dimethyl-8-ribityllumazine synthase
MPMLEGGRQAAGLQFAVVVSRYNDFVTERLLTGARDGLATGGVAEADVTVLRVPGAFEIPIAAQRAAETGRFAAVIALGCLIRGATPHFDYIASAVSHALAAAASATGVPIAFGVLTTNSAEEAIERVGPGPANKGWEAAMAAIEMATLLGTLDAPERSDS